MTTTSQEPAPPASVFSLLDTDLYKLTMQCAVLKYFPDADVTYAFTNRTPDMLFRRDAFHWLREEIWKLGNITLSEAEREYLEKECPYLSKAYLGFLSRFHLRPKEQLDVTFVPTENDRDIGEVLITIHGKWVDTILYEIPLLALTSEAYFKFCDKDWNHDGQEEKAYQKGVQLLQGGCVFSEFGSRRRRDYGTHDLVMQGLCRAWKEGQEKGWPGKFLGTSNVHFAHKYGVAPIGTVAHEWYMGIAAITDNYEDASELGLRYWVGTFGEGVLGIALTDTFGTPAFLKAFNRPVPAFTSSNGMQAATPSSVGVATQTTDRLAGTTPPPPAAPIGVNSKPCDKTYAQVFAGVRQDSGDPKDYVKMLRDFYHSIGIKEKKQLVFSDSLNIERCFEYKKISEEAGFAPSFGIGTFMTNDFRRLSDGKKSVPLNIVIKISSAGNRPAIKLSDNLGKNTGDHQTVVEVKKRLGYIEKEWKGGDERHRWNE